MSKKILTATAFSIAALPFLVYANTDKHAERSGRKTWIERPWELRYFIQVQMLHTWQFSKKQAEKNNADSSKTNFHWKAFFNPDDVIKIPNWRTQDGSYPEDKAVVVIKFDRDGFVTSPHTHSGRLRGRLDWLRYIDLSEGDELKDREYSLGQWFTGLDEDTPIEVTPAICNGSPDMPGPFSAEDEYYIYGNKFILKPGSDLGFGCREWAFQLHSSGRPYIDVTTYSPKGRLKGSKSPYVHGTYINDFIGWSTFDVRKPVIGKHADTWYCLHDCPGDDKPGKIDNIKLWAARNGWNPPRPPTRVPTFTDNPGLRGTYIN